MATTSLSLSLSLSSPNFFNVLKPKPYLLLITTHKSYLPFSSRTTIPSKRTIIFEYPIDRTRRKGTPILTTYASSGDALPLESPSVDDAQQIVSASGDNGVAPIISILLFVAFLGLTILTFGVVYLGVKEFLDKREREKFQKEESTDKKKKKNGKKKVRARAGPRGFGQKVKDGDEDVD